MGIMSAVVSHQGNGNPADEHYLVSPIPAFHPPFSPPLPLPECMCASPSVPMPSRLRPARVCAYCSPVLVHVPIAYSSGAWPTSAARYEKCQFSGPYPLLRFFEPKTIPRSPWTTWSYPKNLKAITALIPKL